MEKEKNVMGSEPATSCDVPKYSSSCSKYSCVNGDDDNKKLYKGVRKRKWGKWVSEIRLPNSRERIWLGSYDCAEKAARAFDAALYCLRGRNANFNFPDTPCNVPLPPHHHSLTSQQIQEVASKFANHHVCVSINNQHQQQQQLHDQVHEHDHGNGSGDHVNSNVTTSTSDGTVQVEEENGGDTMDWTFLNVFDNYSTNEVVPVASDYSFSELDKNIIMHSGELMYSTPPPPSTPFQDIYDHDDPFSHQSFLWSWNF